MALSSETWREGPLGLTSIEWLPALLIGLEKLNAGRGRPWVEYSELKDGERATEALVLGENGE